MTNYNQSLLAYFGFLAYLRFLAFIRWFLFISNIFRIKGPRSWNTKLLDNCIDISDQSFTYFQLNNLAFKSNIIYKWYILIHILSFFICINICQIIYVWKSSRINHVFVQQCITILQYTTSINIMLIFLRVTVYLQILIFGYIYFYTLSYYLSILWLGKFQE